jgi:hypothetical protein
VYVNVQLKNRSANPSANPLGKRSYLGPLKIDKIANNFKFSPCGPAANNPNAFGKHGAAFGYVYCLLKPGYPVS